MTDTRGSKELTALIVLSVCTILIIGFYVIPQASSLGGNDGPELPTDNDNTKNDTQQVTGFNGSKVGISGIMIENNSIITDIDDIIESHISYLSGKSRELVSDRPNSKDIFKIFGDRVVISEGQNKTPYAYKDREYRFRRQSNGDSNSYSIYDEGITTTSYNITDDVQSILRNMTPDTLINTSGGVLLQLSPDNTTQEFREAYNASSPVINSTIRISEEGYVKSYSIYFESSGILSQVDRYAFRISQLGSVDVFEPDWVQVAKNQNLVANTTIDKQNSWIKIEHLDFKEVPKGATIEILTSQGVIESELPSRFSPGDVLYLVAEDSTTWNVETSNPTSGNVQFNDSEFILEISDGNQVIYSELIQPST